MGLIWLIRSLSNSDMDRRTSGTAGHVKVDAGFRLVGAPGAGAMRQEQADQITRLCLGAVETEIGDPHRCLMNGMQNRQTALPVARRNVRIILVNCHLGKPRYTLHNSRRQAMFRQ
ncbi:hypothetical protein AGR3A_Cc250088 [Agrobacterium tomkonis CFBP 6623]|uniref:Uncharacterized protein n=1 Tax=Agrobacterium tomkonis CFBP 6623 TaxID=1183432 RepID=A0A1S7PDI5_9HYPH|nr:hypothetical protein AGR3A_Cc250088 [Agrobacterium tomkonis CFBP 6623]